MRLCVIVKKTTTVLALLACSAKQAAQAASSEPSTRHPLYATAPACPPLGRSCDGYGSAVSRCLPITPQSRQERARVQ